MTKWPAQIYYLLNNLKYKFGSVNYAHKACLFWNIKKALFDCKMSWTELVFFTHVETSRNLVNIIVYI